MAGFTVDVRGRVRNFDLPKQQPLIPLFETIVNSIYAIEDKKEKEKEKEDFKGKIDITIIREPQERLEGTDPSINEIIGFEVSDNGIGFDENNMNSFLQSDSTYRAEKGGKGVGRFSWLKAFEKASIESLFWKENDRKWAKRGFVFSLDTDEIDDQYVLIDEDVPLGSYTLVRLMNYLPAYRNSVPKTAETIALRIMQHCMIYLMSKECPEINLIDEERISINKLFEEKIVRDDNKVDVTLCGESFTLRHTKVQDASIACSKIYMFANDRMVTYFDVDKLIVDLDKQLYQREGFYYVGILTGNYLDNNVGMNRTAFDIPDNSEDGFISMSVIKEAMKFEVERYLDNHLQKVRAEKNERIRNYINGSAPQFKPLLKYKVEDVNQIKPSLSDAKLDEELYKIRRTFEKQIKEENQVLIDEIAIGQVPYEEYAERLKAQVEKISDSNKAVLSEYVTHRKVIIELLKKGIRIDDISGKFQKEAYIHSLIYPMRKTSDEVFGTSHNLWLIDERLAYCEYISSDVPFDNDNSQDRTDIMFLDRPVALSDNNNGGRAYESIIIIELKKPMRNDYNMAENPINQMLRYVEELRSNNKKDKAGRPIVVNDNTQFYLYAVCDLTDKLREVAKMHDLKETPDGLGLYRYHDAYHAYIEVISFDKLINDSEKRNRVLFDKLGI